MANGLTQILRRSLPAPKKDPLTGDLLGGEVAIRPQPSLLGGGRVIEGEVVPPSFPDIFTGGSGRSVIEDLMPPSGGGGGGRIPTTPLAVGGAVGGGSLLLNSQGPTGFDIPEEEEEASQGNILKDAADVLVQDAAAQKGISADQERNNTEQEVRDAVDDPSFFDAFSSEFDLTTLGLALLASNDGKNSFGVNLGNALNAARKAAQGKVASKRKAEREDARDAREERKLELETQRVAIQAASEQRKAIDAQRKSAGVAPAKPSPSQRSRIASIVEAASGEAGLFKHKGKKANSSHIFVLDNAASALDLAEKQARNQGRVLTQSEINQIALDNTLPFLEGSTFLGFSTGGQRVSEEAVQRAAQGQQPAQNQGGVVMINGVPVVRK